MVLTEREKYTCHFSIITLLASLGHIKRKDADMILNKIKDMRCRHISNEELKELYDELKQEFLLSTGLYKDLENI